MVKAQIFGPLNTSSECLVKDALQISTAWTFQASSVGQEKSDIR